MLHPLVAQHLHRLHVRRTHFGDALHAPRECLTRMREPTAGHRGRRTAQADRRFGPGFEPAAFFSPGFESSCFLRIVVETRARRISL
eukprot:7389222-Prymnesium_polylepis.1